MAHRKRELIDLSIIIVNWNVCDLLDKCLASIYMADVAISNCRDGQTLIEIIVVDCASEDDSVAMVREKYPEVKLLPQSENLGFTRGNNLGMATAVAPVFLLLNPDTEVCNDAIGTMLDYMNRHPQVGILGPQTLNSDGTHQSTRRRFPTLLTGIYESTWLSAWAPASVMDRYLIRDSDNDDIMQVDWVQGSALMLRREVYVGLDGLDDAFVMYSEELDFCKRAKAAKWNVVYHGGALITHHGGKSSDQVPAFTQIHFHTGKLRYFRKHHGHLAYLFLRIILLAQFFLQLTLECGKAAAGHKREMRLRRIKVYWQVIRSGLKAKA